MGVNHLKLANEFSINNYGKELNFNSLESFSLLNTESLDGVTDSAAAITAIMSFEKTNNSKINIDKEGNKLNPVTYHFKDTKYKIAVISSNSIVDASPAGMYAKTNDRTNYNSISNQLLESQFDLFIGGGRAFVTEEDIKKKGYDYKREMNLDNISENNEIILTSYANNPLIKDSRNDDYYKNSIEYALKKFEDEKFFIFIEGGRIDHAAHAHDSLSVIEEIIAFDKSLKPALDFYSENPDNTIILFTADHETGGLSLGDGFINIDNLNEQKYSYDKLISLIKEKNDFEDFKKISNIYFLSEEDYEKAFSDNNISYFDDFVQKYFNHYNSSSGVKWSTYGHTINNVPLFTNGIKYDNYIDLTDIFWDIIKK
jgi:alkaline phosphatase